MIWRHSTESLLINHGEDYLVVKERLDTHLLQQQLILILICTSKTKTLANKLDDLFKMEKLVTQRKQIKKQGPKTLSFILYHGRGRTGTSLRTLVLSSALTVL